MGRSQSDVVPGMTGATNGATNGATSPPGRHRPEEPEAQVASGSVYAAGSAFRGADRMEPVAWHLAEEAPVAFVYNTESHTVMMATPADLEDFALGFSLAEEIVDDPRAVLLVKPEAVADGWRLCIAVDPDHLGRGAAVQRGMAGRTGCGLCGVDSLDGAVRPVRRRTPGAGLDPNAIPAEALMRAFEDLPAHQPMNRQNRSVHAAAFCDAEGRILVCREDVGRHNALDKVIGAAVRAGYRLADGFVVMTSRCSFELVQKAVAVGIPLLATLSAPTALAVDLAGRAGMGLAALARPGGVVMFRAPPDQQQQEDHQDQEGDQDQED